MHVFKCFLNRDDLKCMLKAEHMLECLYGEVILEFFATFAHVLGT